MRLEQTDPPPHASQVTQLGQAWIELRVPTDVSWNRTLEGTCLIQALAADVWLPEVHCEIALHGDDYEGQTGCSAQVSPPRWQDVRVPRGERLDLTFQAVIPGGPHGRDGKAVLRLRGRQPWMATRLVLPFTVVPPPHLAAFVEQLGMLCGLPQVKWVVPQHKLCDGIAQLRHRGEPHARLAEVNLELYEALGRVRGYLEVLPREGTWLSSLLREHDLFAIDFPADDLQAGLESMIDHLRGYFREHPNLPVPAGEPQVEKNPMLPVPAQPAADEAGRLPIPTSQEGANLPHGE